MTYFKVLFLCRIKEILSSRTNYILFISIRRLNNIKNVKLIALLISKTWIMVTKFIINNEINDNLIIDKDYGFNNRKYSLYATLNNIGILDYENYFSFIKSNGNNWFKCK